MKVDNKNIRAHELIGLNVRVVELKNRSLLGLSGRIVDETKNTFIIESAGGVKMVPKANTFFQLTLTDGSVVSLNGSEILGRPEDRVSRLK